MEKLEEFLSQILLALILSYIEENSKKGKYKYDWCLEDEFNKLKNQCIKIYTQSNVIEGTVSEVGSDFIRIDCKKANVSYIVPKNCIYAIEKGIN
ncbi:hypothetical protein Tthe_2103 [Thermoanaerobacterium thermosaccharolyticum DSM 571]|uniref:Uncharacterized protein n=1 Tax=Thermoanaerobacterium thermosaccharolyticum (strain ATCC 7956 / DSM 571 / NCIMB 9385 / NCA 3814 / NCTC 13789 / WDCM 00135 / 2032) TaxID=580327 RepID=D9TR84_THETC|nr:hypothetical protein [Thermoanaerobacterium thermosaccharolyticum]ADL69582.1 hypothetical protein Tthe_2103 [Thermoanaerobacterium thermosaccharolyticum DSM 571]